MKGKKLGDPCCYRGDGLESRGVILLERDCIKGSGTNGSCQEARYHVQGSIPYHWHKYSCHILSYGQNLSTLCAVICCRGNEERKSGNNLFKVGETCEIQGSRSGLISVTCCPNLSPVSRSLCFTSLRK